MRAILESSTQRSWTRLLLVLMVGVGVSNCSSDSTRLAESPLQNPWGNRPPEATGAIAPRSAPVGRVESRPLAQPVMAQPLAAPPPAVSAPSSTAPRGYNTSSYQQPPAMGRTPAPEVTGTVPRLRAAKPAAGAQSWNWEGGTPITVAHGDTLSSLSRRYGVPATAIAEANGLAGPVVLQPGRRLVIPRYAGPAAEPRTAQAAGPRAAAAAPAGVHVVAPGETLVAISKRYRVPIQDIASANNIVPHAVLKIGDRLTIPSRAGSRSAELQPAAVAPHTPAPVQRVEAPAPAPIPVAQRPVAEPAPAATAARVTPVNAVVEEDRSSDRGSLAFRWPVRGRVIAGYGKSNGQNNDGINLAVPEGTAVKSAEDGVVAYAGNELKGYGNLVLVRHANGFVTAYAHNSEIMVKRNDPVRRGQVIAKSGQTGTVTSPQLHFEIRKGSSPIDPMEHLPPGA